MLWAAATMCFFGFLRAGEVVVATEWGGLRCIPPFVRRRCPGGQQVDTTIPRGPHQGIKDGPVPERCNDIPRQDSVQWRRISDYMVRRGTEVGPFFRFGDGSPLTRERFVGGVRRALAAAGLDDSCYSGHCYRIGAASTAAQRGMQDSLIKTLGRWESSAYTLYVRMPRETLCAVSRALANEETRL
jgi:hypothetical protein